jgi:hypothetical protein
LKVFGLEHSAVHSADLNTNRKMETADYADFADFILNSKPKRKR